MNSLFSVFIIFRDKEENSFMFLKTETEGEREHRTAADVHGGVRYILHQGRTQRTDIGVRRGTYV